MNVLKNSKKKIFCFSFVLALFMLVFTANIFADTTSSVTGIIDDKTTQGAYKLSDDKADIYLPFIRFASERILVDKSVSSMGTIFSGTSIEVNSEMKGVQSLFSYDTTRVNANMEYGFIFAGQDVVIDSNITRSLVIFSNGKVTITENANISEDVVVFAKSLEINGTVKGSVIGATSSLTVNGKIEKDLRIETENATFSGKDNVLGNIFIRTTNEALTVADNYPNAKVDLVTNTKQYNNSMTLDKFIQIITSCLLLALLYIFIQKIGEKKAFTTLFTKCKQNILFVVLAGVLGILTIPFIVIILFMLSIVGLSIITVPLMIAYASFIIITIMLSTFLVGSVSFDYAKNKYLKDSNIWSELLGVFCTFLVLKLIILIPYLGSYLEFAIIIAAVGMAITSIFKKNK
jgi:cytoskeletal protein CcmA (bactofilin family)